MSGGAAFPKFMADSAIDSDDIIEESMSFFVGINT